MTPFFLAAWLLVPVLAALPPLQQQEHIVVLHGLARSHHSMAPMAESLERAGYRVHNINYPSTEFPIETLADSIVGEAVDAARAESAARIHFVTHSMGGLVVRHYLETHRLPELGRVVMLSPPNRGSEVADAFEDLALFQWIYGPAGQQLGTAPDDLPARLEPVDFPLGVLTGTRSIDPVGSALIPGPDDGKVAVDRARAEGMSDFLALAATHTFIMRDDEAIAQTLHFLRHGRFARPEGASGSGTGEAAQR